MSQSFDCPKCGAPLDYDGIGETQRCPFCNNSVVVPAELRQAAPSSPAPAPSGHADELGEIAFRVTREKSRPSSYIAPSSAAD